MPKEINVVLEKNIEEIVVRDVEVKVEKEIKV